MTALASLAKLLQSLPSVKGGNTDPLSGISVTPDVSCLFFCQNDATQRNAKGALAPLGRIS